MARNHPVSRNHPPSASQPPTQCLSTTQCPESARCREPRTSCTPRPAACPPGGRAPSARGGTAGTRGRAGTGPRPRRPARPWWTATGGVAFSVVLCFAQQQAGAPYQGLWASTRQTAAVRSAARRHPPCCRGAPSPEVRVLLQAVLSQQGRIGQLTQQHLALRTAQGAGKTSPVSLSPGLPFIASSGKREGEKAQGRSGWTSRPLREPHAPQPRVHPRSRWGQRKPPLPRAAKSLNHRTGGHHPPAPGTAGSPACAPPRPAASPPARPPAAWPPAPRFRCTARCGPGSKRR